MQKIQIKNALIMSWK